MDLYRELIIDHYKNPKNWGTISNSSKSEFMSNPSCGDEIKVDLIIKNNIINDFKFTGRGCAISIAATSLLSEEIIGKNINEIKNMKIKDVEELLGIKLSTSRIKCGMLGLETLKKMLRDLTIE